MGAGKMRKCREQNLPTDGSEWPHDRLKAWAAPRPQDSLVEAHLRQMLLSMCAQGKAVPDGTDAEGNPTFRFR